MKSLALHLIGILLVGTLHTLVNTHLAESMATAKSTSTTSTTSTTSITSLISRSSGMSTITEVPKTTSPLPSLRAPRRLRSTTVMTQNLPTTANPTKTATKLTTSAVTPTTRARPVAPLLAAVSKRQRESVVRRSSSSAHAKSTANAVPDVATTPKSFTSTRLVRNVEDTIGLDTGTATRSGRRQNRSSPIRRSDSSNADANFEKYDRPERRHLLRTNQYSSANIEDIITSNNVSATTFSSDIEAVGTSNSTDSRVNPGNKNSAFETTTPPGPPSLLPTTSSVTISTTTLQDTIAKEPNMSEHTPSLVSERHQSEAAQSKSRNYRQSKQSRIQSAEGTKFGQQPSAIQQNSTKSPLTSKTPRMIQRLVAGHLENSGGITSQISTTSSSMDIMEALPVYFRRKQPVLSSSFRQSSQFSGTTMSTPKATSSKYQTKYSSNEYDDDEALLDDPNDFDNWDNGILRLSAGSGKEKDSFPKARKNKEDTKKTLSDQVRDGKYGLIEKELFRREPKRPGVLSYLSNKEVPVDNENNFGGLQEEDIWLAEDHLLVIKGGSLNDDASSEPWPSLDDYDAPGRQIKIPKNPKVPPPFPVQLEENGPVQFIGNNKFTVVYPVANESIPVYPIGPETNYNPSESESDDEKNLIARPGPQQSPAEGEPGFVYPEPYPPWLYHNQTFVNPFLTNSRPITFPGLGPFPFGRNGSLENANITDYFDEDDPSLYYPPAYSFVYKNNYTNPVPPGPLVPGIVLPPPANQFSRLVKTEKLPSTSNQVSNLPSRHRIYSISSSTTTSPPPPPSSTTTTTTSTTTESPFSNVITKISQYTPKTIIITPAPPQLSSSIPPSTPISQMISTSTHRPSPTTHFNSQIQPVPVPVAVPVPIYSSNSFTNPPPQSGVVSFVPTTQKPTDETLSKTNPIYYEYFEAKRQPPVTSNVIQDFLSTTAKSPVSSKPAKLYATSKRPNKGHRNYLQPVPTKHQFLEENIVYITPKPEFRYKVLPPPAPVYKQRPLDNFEREVNALRETLRYYQNKQLRDNNIPRTTKTKPLYEYTFDATKNLQPVHPTDSNGHFQPPKTFDEEPFKPMVTYSPPVGDENSFHALAFDKVDEQNQNPEQQKYQPTTTLIPNKPDVQYPTPHNRPKKLRFGAKYLQQPVLVSYSHQQPSQNEVDYHTTPRTILTTQQPWVSVDKQEIENYRHHSHFPQQPQSRQQSERLQMPGSIQVNQKNRGFTGYYYGAPSPPIRQNNRFYDEPFHNPVRKIINYRPQPNLPQPIQHQPQQSQQPAQPQHSSLWSLENDTYVNYGPNRPPLNPDAEFVDPYQTVPVNPYATGPGHRFPYVPPPGPPLPALSHQSQYYALPQRLPPQRQYSPHSHHPQIPLHRDILVNYRQPLPPINPDSEYISHPQVVRNQQNQIFRSHGYRRLPSPLTAIEEPYAGAPNLYYLSQKYRRSNNSQNSKGTNNDDKTPEDADLPATNRNGK